MGCTRLRLYGLPCTFPREFVAGLLYWQTMLCLNKYCYHKDKDRIASARNWCIGGLLPRPGIIRVYAVSKHRRFTVRRRCEVPVEKVSRDLSINQVPAKGRRQAPATFVGFPGCQGARADEYNPREPSLLHLHCRRVEAARRQRVARQARCCIHHHVALLS